MGPESWRWTGLQVGGGGEPDMYRMKQHTLRIMSATFAHSDKINFQIY